MDELSRKVLGMFGELGKESLDLHELFEAGGNDPEERRAVFYAIERLVELGLLDERGNDFYALTEEGKKASEASREETAGGDGGRQDL